MDNPLDTALTQLQNFGLKIQEVQTGRIVRKQQDRNLAEHEWYILREWRSPKTGKVYIFGKAGTWRDRGADIAIEPSVEQGDLPDYHTQRKEMQAQVETERKQVHADAAKRAQDIWEHAKFGGESEYLTRKGIMPHTARFMPDRLVISVHDLAGKVHGLEAIFHDGSKRFLGGMAKRGHFHLIGELPAGNEPVAIVEGFATGASVREAMGWPVVVAFDAGNLGPVAEEIRRACPRANIIFCADDDHSKPKNAGKDASEAAAKAVRGMVALPRFTEPEGKSDWNDLHQAEGLGALREQLSAITRPEAPEIDITSFDETPERQVEWLWPGVIPRGLVSMLGGKQGLGKSFVVADLASRVSTGDEMPDGSYSSQSGENVLILPREDPADSVLKPRIRAASGDMKRIYWSVFRDAKTGEFLDLATAHHKLLNIIVQYDIKLVIVDTFAAFAEADSDQNSAGDVRRLLNALSAVAQETGAAILVIAHLRKAASTQKNQDIDPMDSFAGSAQMTAGVRVASMLEPAQSAEEGVRWFRVVKSNLGRIHRDGWTWVFDHGGNPESMPRIKWAASEADMAARERKQRSGVCHINVADVVTALAPIIEDGPQPLSRCVAAVAIDLRAKPGYERVARASIEAVILKLARDGEECVTSVGPRRDSVMVCRPGQQAETTEERAIRIATENPGISVRQLKEMAGCRTATAKLAVELTSVSQGVSQDCECVPTFGESSDTPPCTERVPIPTHPRRGCGKSGHGHGPKACPEIGSKIDEKSGHERA